MASGTQRETEVVGPGHRPLCRGLGRRDAAHGGPLHHEQRPAGQRPVHLPGLPGRDPRPRRDPERRLGLPGPHLGPRHPDAGRLAQRAGGDEPGGAQGQHRADGQGDGAPGQQRRLRGAQPGQGGLRDQPPDRRLPQRLHGLRGPHDLHHPGGLQGGRGQAPRRRALQELLRAGPGELALHPAGRGHRRMDHAALRRQAPGGRGQHPRLPGRLRLRRDGRAVRVQLRDPSRHLREGRVRPGHGQPGPGLGADRRPPAWPGCRSSWAATRSPRRRTSCTS